MTHDLDVPGRSRWIAPFVLVVIGLALPTGYLAWRGLLPGGGETLSAARGADDPAAETGAMMEELRPVGSVVLYFSDRSGERLISEMRDVAGSEDPSSRAASIVRELAAGSRSGLARTVPADVEVLHVFVDDVGVVYLDLSGDLVDRHTGGTRGEILTLRSIARSISANDPRVSGVRLLVDGRELDSIHGHVDLSRELRIGVESG
ncbi:MAG: hypothetical protein CME06_07995 [Gemmatimonadetes bacterium]|nr:hypothetical protein [Gemmatimonadota bacterium]